MTEAPKMFVEVAQGVALNYDGTVVITTDGTIQQQMYRMRSPGADGDRT